MLNRVVKVQTAFTDELQRCDLLGIPHLVVHPGANPDKQRGLRNVAEALDRSFAAHRGRCQVLLETAAGQGSGLGSQFDELREMRELCRSPERVAVCLAYAGASYALVLAALQLMSF